MMIQAISAGGIGDVGANHEKQIPITFYQPLPDSVLEFPNRETFVEMMEKAGFIDVRVHDLTGGIAAVHVGTRAG